MVEDFVAEYAAGRTPNPCLRCNEKIKFAAVLDRAVALGFDAVCTGHYARLVRTGTEVQLHRAVDDAKDQSYVLGVLTQDQLRQVVLPTRLLPQVRRPGRGRPARAPVADKPDSHDICFIADGDTAGFLDAGAGRAGRATIVEPEGGRSASTRGSHQFTVGQRRGLRLGVPAGDGRPRYVLDISPVTNTVTVGPHDGLAVRPSPRSGPTWTRRAPAGPGPGRRRSGLTARRCPPACTST